MAAIEQIRIYDEHGFNELFLGETEFFSARYRTEMMESADKIESLRPNLTFSIEGHPGVFSEPRLAHRLVQAGILRFSIGAESGSTGVLRRIGRNSTRDEILRAVRNLSAAGGLVQTSWICNLPGETDAEFCTHLLPGPASTRRLAAVLKKVRVPFTCPPLHHKMRWPPSARLSPVWIGWQPTGKSRSKWWSIRHGTTS